jgi:hypothetical protein
MIHENEHNSETENCHYSDTEHISTATPSKISHKLVVHLNKASKLGEFYTELTFFM